jgi:hypothetical protein
MHVPSMGQLRACQVMPSHDSLQHKRAAWCRTAYSANTTQSCMRQLHGAQPQLWLQFHYTAQGGCGFNAVRAGCCQPLALLVLFATLRRASYNAGPYQPEGAHTSSRSTWADMLFVAGLHGQGSLLHGCCSVFLHSGATLSWMLPIGNEDGLLNLAEPESHRSAGLSGTTAGQSICCCVLHSPLGGHPPMPRWVGEVGTVDASLSVGVAEKMWVG